MHPVLSRDFNVLKIQNRFLIEVFDKLSNFKHSDYTLKSCHDSHISTPVARRQKTIKSLPKSFQNSIIKYQKYGKCEGNNITG